MFSFESFNKDNTFKRRISSTTASICSDLTFQTDDEDNDSVFESIETISKRIDKNEINLKNYLDLINLEDNSHPYSCAKYGKHSYLDLKKISFKQQIRLRWLQNTKWSNIARCLMIVFCLIWFAINGWTILKDYLKHDSLVFLEYNTPTKTVPPGITICTHCILCDIHNSTNERIITRHLFTDSFLLKYINNHESSDHKTQYRNIKINCTIILNGYNHDDGEKIPCEEVVTTMLSMQEGHKCFTLFSNLFGQMRTTNRTIPQLDYDMMSYIDIKITGNFLPIISDDKNDNGYEYVDKKYNNRTTGYFVTVHDPEILPDMNEAGFHKLLLGRTHHLQFTKITQELLSPPFLPLCHPYSKQKFEQALNDPSIYLKNKFLTNKGLSIYRSKGECVLFCLWRMLNANRCTNFFSIFTEEMVEKEERFETNKIINNFIRKNSNKTSNTVRFRPKMCPINNARYDNYVGSKLACDKICQPACTINTYSADIFFDEPYHVHDQINIKIYWSQQMYTLIKHRPKMDLTDFLGNLGGQAHIWIGISVLHIVKFLINSFKYAEFEIPNRDCCSILHWIMECFAIGKRR